MIAARTTTPAQRIVIALFFSFFLLMGCGGLCVILIRPVALSVAARQWMAVPCRVISSEVRSHSGRGATYSVEITYAYQVDGKEYHSDRYQFLRSSSSGRAGKASVVAQYRRGTQAVCFVNPKEPSEAVLDRGIVAMAWFGVIPLVFVAIGLAGIIGAIKGKGNAVSSGNPNSDPPWLLRPDWAAGRIASSTKKGMLGAWLFAAVWNLISMPAAWMVLSEHEIKKENYGPAFVLFLPLVGVGMLCWAVRLTLRWLRFGESIFEMACVPGGIGGPLEGTIRLSRPIRPEGPVKLRLSCLVRTTSSDGGNTSSTSERVLWQHEETVELNAPDTIPVAFYIPGECSETTTLDASDGTLWRLEATAKVPGVDYAAQFEVPVFRVEQTPEQRAEAQKLIAHEQAEVAAYVQPPSSRIRVQTSLRGGTEFYFPACRNPGAAIFLTVFLAVWSAVIWFMLSQKAPILFPVVFGFFDLILVLIAAHIWTGTTRVLVNPAGVAVTNTVLGIPRTTAVAAQDIEDIKTKIGMTSGNTAYHDIKIQCRNGKNINAGSAIKDLLEAEWLAAEMMKALVG